MATKDFLVRAGIVVSTNASVNTALSVGTINATSNGFYVDSSGITYGNSSVNVSINATSFSGTSNNSTNFGGLSLTTVQGQITGNAATAYSNAVANAAALYATTGQLSGNVSTLQGQITGNAATAYTNATTYASNATNISTGTLATARLPSTINTSAINVGANVNLSTTTINVGNATVNTVVSGGNISFSGTDVSTSITGNASTAYTNATAYASNATNISTGTLAYSRLPANLVNTSASFTITGMYTYSNGITFSNTITASGSNGQSGQVLTSAGPTGNVYWANATGGSGTPGGSNTYVQFNDSGSFNGIANLAFDKTTSILTVSNTISVGNTTVNTDITGSGIIFNDGSVLNTMGQIIALYNNLAMA